MADIIKHISRGIPPTTRSIEFTEADAGVGDVLQVEASLGHPARNIMITANQDLTVAFNVYQTIFPRQKDFSIPYSEGNLLLASGIQVFDMVVSGFGIDVVSGTPYESHGEFPIQSIALLSGAAEFDIYLT